MGAAITDSEVFAINVEDTDGASADFDDFAFTDWNFVCCCYYVFGHLGVGYWLIFIGCWLLVLGIAMLYATYDYDLVQANSLCYKLESGEVGKPRLSILNLQFIEIVKFAGVVG